METIDQMETKAILALQEELDAARKTILLQRAEIATLTTQLTRKSFDILKNNNQHQGE